MPKEQLNILGYLYFFMENFNNSILILKLSFYNKAEVTTVNFTRFRFPWSL